MTSLQLLCDLFRKTLYHRLMYTGFTDFLGGARIGVLVPIMVLNITS